MISIGKTALLVNLLKQPEATRSIVFVRKRERVHELAAKLYEAGITTCWLEGEMVQIKRNEAIKRLTDGQNVLIATDVAARGIDIPDVSHVFNFDMPRTADIYLHLLAVPAVQVRKAPLFRWLKRTITRCWAKSAATLKNR